MDLWRYIYRSTWFVLTVLIVGGLACIFVPEYGKYTEYRNQIEALDSELAEQEQVLRALKTKQDRFKTERRYVEFIAHEVGMVHPHETIFKIRDDQASTSRHVSRRP